MAVSIPSIITEPITAKIGPILTSFTPLESLRQTPKNVSNAPTTRVPLASIPVSTKPSTITAPIRDATPRVIPIIVLKELSTLTPLVPKASSPREAVINAIMNPTAVIPFFRVDFFMVPIIPIAIVISNRTVPRDLRNAEVA